MRNVLAVLLIAAGAIAALKLTGDDGTGAAATGAAGEQPAAPRWEYRVVGTRVTPPAAARRESAHADVRLLTLTASSTSAAPTAAAADRLGDLERQLNRLGGEGWEMCSAAADGTMVFRRAR